MFGTFIASLLGTAPQRGPNESPCAQSRAARQRRVACTQPCVVPFSAPPEAQIVDFGLGEDDLVVEYDASRRTSVPAITVETLDNGDQHVLADGLVVATLVQPLVPITAEDVLVVGLL